MNVDKEKILNQFESGEIKIALTEEQEKALYESLPFKQSRAEYEFIKSALEKQIPKKPDSAYQPKFFWCSICRCAIQQKVPNSEVDINYCPYCGQRIDWGNNDNESQS